MEPRLITRWEAARWAREAYDIGARCDALDSQTNALDSQTNALDRLMLLIVRLRLMLMIVETAHDKKTTQTGCWEVVVGSSHTI